MFFHKIILISSIFVLNVMKKAGTKSNLTNREVVDEKVSLGSIGAPAKLEGTQVGH